MPTLSQVMSLIPLLHYALVENETFVNVEYECDFSMAWSLYVVYSWSVRTSMPQQFSNSLLTDRFQFWSCKKCPSSTANLPTDTQKSLVRQSREFSSPQAPLFKCVKRFERAWSSHSDVVLRCSTNHWADALPRANVKIWAEHLYCIQFTQSCENFANPVL